MVRFRHLLSAVVLAALVASGVKADVNSSAGNMKANTMTDEAATNASSNSSPSNSSPSNSSPSNNGPSNNSPKLQDVFKSLQDSTQGKAVELPMKPIAIGGAAIVLMSIALKQWNRRQSSPKPLSNHRKLLTETARASGMSRRKLHRVAPLAMADGLSSPLVAIICPSAIKRLAKVVRTADEQAALKSFADSLFRAEGAAKNSK